MDTPFLRWAGGKRWLTGSLVPLLKEAFKGRYVEPFLGSGAMFFALSPQKAELSDINDSLINAYHWVRREPLEIQRIISGWPVDAVTYYQVRANSSLVGVEAAARFIYLNRTCYGGLHRTNRKGQFNTPFGGGSRTPEVLWKNGTLARCAYILEADVAIRCSDFQVVIDRTVEGDLVFCDPIYGSATGKQFDRYGATKFCWDDQKRLASAITRAAERGVTSVVCNSALKAVEDLYPDSYLFKMSRKKSIGNARVHGSDEELVVIIDPHRRKALWSRLGNLEADRSQVKSIRDIRRAHFSECPGR